MNDSFGRSGQTPRDVSPPRMPQMPQMPKLPFPPKLLLLFPLLLILLIGGWSSFYTVEAEEVGVVLRFGKYKTTADRGLHFRIPFGVDQVYKVPVRRQMKQEFGFGTPGAGNDFQSSSPREWGMEKQMVTGDLNSALVEWVVQYRIDDPKQYLFNVRNPDETLRNASESVMREAVGDRTVDEVLTIGRQGIENEALGKLQALTNKYEMGLRIDQVQLKNVNPPVLVQSSFNEVNEAEQEGETVINEANGSYNRAVPRAGGEAKRRINDAKGYAIQRINEAEGDSARFNALYTEYVKAPLITKRRIYLETMGEVIPKLGRKIILDEDAKQILPLLNLNNSTPSQ